MAGHRRARGSTKRRIEWPTLVLAAVIYGGWMLVTWFHDRLPPAVLVAAGGWLIAWHGSLQHETIHGHPTRFGRVNGAIGCIPLSLWLPYARYRRDHLAHHETDAVTNPASDPESRYLRRPASPGAQLRLGLAACQASLIGRLVLGPPILVLGFLSAEARRAVRAPAAVLAEWAPHLSGVLLVVAWLTWCRLSLPLYLLAFVYPGTALTLLRSFAEHRAHATPGHRVAIVESRGPLALLFLNNNLHAAHHEAPAVPWYRLAAYHRDHRPRLLRDNGGLVYRGYGEVARRYIVRRHDVLVHPDHALSRFGI